MNDEFRHRTRVEVRFRDIDAFGHVNNAVVATYVEQARIRYLCDVLDLDPVARFPMILAMIRLDYTSPVLFDDAIEVGSQVDWLGRTSIGMSHRLIADQADRPARELARATSVLVAYDYAQASPMPLPDEWRTALAGHEGRALERPQGVA